ncbi:MAG: 3-phosphoshikimate 1-carboxyvinyltransferase [Chitinivibrionales bacterium]|nr:3-phosphoshikimate 1-carboxyvinyltransferase [Chitinivibrionales bacterium]
MNWEVGKSRLHGGFTVPPSKSHTIRAIIAATLARGTSVVRNPLVHGDGRSALNASVALGAGVCEKEGVLEIEGLDGNYNLGSGDIYTGNSGTTTNLFTAAAALGSKPRRFDGDESLRSRPVKPLCAALEKLGAQCVFENDTRDFPFTIHGPLRGGVTAVDGISSQFVSSLLFTGPLLPEDTTLSVYNVQETPYIDITLWWLGKLGIRCEGSPDYSRFFIPGNQRYACFDQRVPGDFSSATFPAVAAAITGSTLSIDGVDFDDPQGDKEVFSILEPMGVAVERKAGSATVAGPPELTGTTIDLNAMPDSLPALAVAACCAEGTTRIVNVAHARIKECDRIGIIADELGRMGADIQVQNDGLLIRKSRLSGTRVDGHNDHRVVMALALAGMVAEGKTVVTTAEASHITYPSFAGDFKKAGAALTVSEE